MEAVEGSEQRKPKILMAGGDVHDIGKIVGIVLQCNDYEVVDLAMVPAQHH